MDESEENKNRLFDQELRILQGRRVGIWNLYNSGNLEVKMEVDFEKFLMAVGDTAKVDVELLTTFRFYSLLDYLKEKVEKNG